MVMVAPGLNLDAHYMLDSIHNWFTEGCDAADLIDAKALLGDLA